MPREYRALTLCAAHVARAVSCSAPTLQPLTCRPLSPLPRFRSSAASDDDDAPTSKECLAVASAATQALPHLLLVAPAAVNAAGACAALVAWISATPPTASTAAAYAEALTSLEAMCYLTNAMAVSVVESGIALRPALLEESMPLNLRVAALKLLSAVARCGERAVCEVGPSPSSVFRLVAVARSAGVASHSAAVVLHFISHTCRPSSLPAPLPPGCPCLNLLSLLLPFLSLPPWHFPWHSPTYH